MWAASNYNSGLNWQIENLEAGCKHSLLWCHFEIECWVIAWMRLYIMLVCWCLSSLSYLKTCLPLCFAVFAIAMPETMEISDAAKSGDGTTQNVGIKARKSSEGFLLNHVWFCGGRVWGLENVFVFVRVWLECSMKLSWFGLCMVSALLQEVGALFPVCRVPPKIWFWEGWLASYLLG